MNRQVGQSDWCTSCFLLHAETRRDVTGSAFSVRLRLCDLRRAFLLVYEVVLMLEG